MEKNYHFIKQRLENLKTIKPMLMSLRTISLSSWRLSLRRLDDLKSYRRDITSVAAQVGALPTPQLNGEKTESCLIILGSTRGLCGGFNRDLLEFYKEHAVEMDGTTEIILFGEKIGKLFNRDHIAYQQSIEYPKINRLDFQFIAQLVANLSCNTKPCRILYNSYHGSGQYQPALRMVNWSHNPALKSVEINQNLIFDTNPLIISEYHLAANQSDGNIRKPPVLPGCRTFFSFPAHGKCHLKYRQTDSGTWFNGTGRKTEKNYQ